MAVPNPFVSFQQHDHKGKVPFAALSPSDLEKDSCVPDLPSHPNSQLIIEPRHRGLACNFNSSPSYKNSSTESEVTQLITSLISCCIKNEIEMKFPSKQQKGCMEV
jgi:hypothetical protein